MPVAGGLMTKHTMTTAPRASSQALSARKTKRPMPSPICSVTPGARNFSGVSMKEMASTMPSHIKIAATATAEAASTQGSLCQQSDENGDVAGVEIASGGHERHRALPCQLAQFGQGCRTLCGGQLVGVAGRELGEPLGLV